MFGKSWGAYNSFQVAAKRPPALKAIAPVMGTDDRWLEDIHFYGGVLATDNFWWGSIMQLYNAMPPDPAIVGEDRWRGMWRERLEAMEFWPAMWLKHQTRDGMWRRGSISENYGDIDIPVYFFGGWADLFRDTPFRIAQHLSCPVKILMGPWAHLYPHEGSPGPKVDFMAEVIRFWDHHLKGIDTGLMDEPPFRFYLQDSARPEPRRKERGGAWVEETAWPSPNVEGRVLYLNPDELGEKAASMDQISITSPQTFGASGGDMCSFAISGDAPADGRSDAGGALAFMGAPLDAALDILGQPAARLRLSADQPRGMVAVLLMDVAPDGTQTLISRGFANLSHRHSDTDPAPVTPGEMMEISVSLHGIGYRIAAGHRLMVQVASAYWPILWQPSAEPVTLSVETGSSVLVLPVRGAPADTPEPRTLPVPPKSDTPRPVTRVREGSMDRSTRLDLTTGIQTQRFFSDGGVFGPVGEMKLDEIGTILGDISDRIYTIRADDPLSARATMEQECTFARDGEWDVRIKTWSEMWADADAFHFRATVTCWDAGTEFHTVEWTDSIPRNGM